MKSLSNKIRIKIELREAAYWNNSLKLTENANRFIELLKSAQVNRHIVFL